MELFKYYFGFCKDGINVLLKNGAVICQIDDSLYNLMDFYRRKYKNQDQIQNRKT